MLYASYASSRFEALSLDAPLLEKVKIKGKRPVLDIALSHDEMNTCSEALYNLGSGS